MTTSRHNNSKWCFISTLVLLFIVSLVNGQEKDDEGPTVNTTTGYVKGFKASTVGDKKSYYFFKGIPYAEAPINELRFQTPVPKARWSEVFNASKEGSTCIQGSSSAIEGTEDCLFVNVYTPRMPSWFHKPLPVLVYIHGGGFAGGSGNYDNNGPDYLIEKDVVFVSFNYRLGIFGFLTTGDLVVPGNNGLKDQVVALKWIRDNIEGFGGDPNQITIWGQSAGSASVAYHLQSPLSRGLFHKAIMDSGVSLSNWAFNKHSMNVTATIAKTLGIDVSQSEELVAAFRKIDAADLQGVVAAVETYNRLQDIPKDVFVYAPVMESEHDGAFQSQKSHQQLSEGDFAKVPCLLGINSLEGAFEDGDGILVKLLFVQYDLNPTKFTPESMNVDDVFANTIVANRVKNNYFGSEPVFLSPDEIMKYLSNHQFDRPSVEFARIVSQHVPVYFYRFSYEGGLWVQNRTFNGTSHSEELGYLFTSKYEPSPEDEVTRQRMVSMWTDFAKTGYPTPRPQDITNNIIWRPFDESYRYLDIGHDLVLSNYPEKENLELWNNLYNLFGKPPYDTY